MSTKTTFKRIALVTVAALGFGTMAAIAPASAAIGATTLAVSDVTKEGYVGETITAAVKVTATGTGALSSEDSFTVSAVLASGPSASAATAVDSVAVDSATASTRVQLGTNKFRLIESATVSNVLVQPTDLAASSGAVTSKVLKPQFGSSTETGTAYIVGYVAFRPTTPGTWTFSIGLDSATAALATAPATYRGGTVTIKVLAAGAVSGDGIALATSALAVNGVAGAGNYNQIKLTGQAVGVGGSSALLGTRFVASTSWESAPTNSILSDDKKTLTIAGVDSITAAKQVIANVLTPSVGTVTVSTYRETAVGSYSATASDVVTITVRATALTGVVASSTAYMTSVTTAAATATTDAAVALTAPSVAATSSDTALARIDVAQLDALEGAADTSKTLGVTAEISGAGRIGKTAATATSYVAVSAGSATAAGEASSTFYVYPDGRSGTGTIIIKVGGVEALKRTVSFTGAATQLKLVAATATAPNPSKSYLAVGGTMTIAVLPYDANNIKLAAAAVTATSDTTTVATVVPAATAGSVTVTGIAVGKTNINIKLGTVVLVVPVEVTKSTGKAVLTLDKTSAQPGEKVTWTITVTDVNGRPTADGTSVALYSAVSANMSVTGGALPTGTETLTGGVATGYFYAPTSGSGTLTITATQGTAHDTYIAGLKAATAAGTTYTALKDVVELTIANAAVDAAAAAAEEATAAANDATDAALSAAEAAEAATAMAQEAVDAVAELSASVTKLISALRAQITTLTNLVVKIQKKVKA